MAQNSIFNQPIFYLKQVKTIIIGVFLLISFLNTQSLFASKSDVEDEVLIEKIEDYKKQKDYNYFKQKQHKVEKQKSSSNISLPSGFGDGFLVLIVILFIVVVALIAYSIIKDGNFGSAKNKDISIPVSNMYENVNEEDISSNDFDSLIQRAKDNGDFRLVLRLMFLKSLQLLDIKKVIIYEKNKTNYEYSFEIKKQGLKNDFIKVSDSFSWIWYGNKSIDENTYDRLNPDFTKLINSIEK